MTPVVRLDTSSMWPSSSAPRASSSAVLACASVIPPTATPPTTTPGSTRPSYDRPNATSATTPARATKRSMIRDQRATRPTLRPRARGVAATGCVAAIRDHPSRRRGRPVVEAGTLRHACRRGKGSYGLLGERVAVVGVATLVPAREPGDALLRRTMRPCLGVHLARGRLLDPVVTDRCRSAQRLIDVARFEVRLVGIRPHAGQAVGLQLLADGKIVPSARVLLGHLLDLIGDPERGLDVVPELVGDDIRHREVTTLG